MTTPLRPRRARWLLPLGYAALLAGCVLAGARQHGPGPRVRAANVAPPAADATRTEVVLTPTAPISAGRNALWSAAGQMAWDALADGLGLGGRLDLGPPAPAAIVADLNAHRFPLSDLDPASYVVVSGTAENGAFDRYLEGVRRLGGHATRQDLPALRPHDVVAFAYLRKEMPFLQPFHVHPEPGSFDGGPRRVVAFGVDPEDASAQAGAMRDRVRVHAPEGAATADGKGVRVAIELVPRDEHDRIVLAAMPAPASLEEGWRVASEWLARPASPLAVGVRLWIPKIDFAADRTFSEMVGAGVRGRDGWFLVDARERIEFTLSESGARFTSSASMGVGCASQPTFTTIAFDRPFLLALMRRGASRPYFLAWFANDDVFVRG